MKLSVLNATFSSVRPWLLLGHLFFGGMLVLSLVYYQERMLALDSAYYSFRLIVGNDLYTGHERYVAYFPQLLPLLVYRLGGSLQAVLMAYSASFILFYYAVYNVVIYLFRSPQAGLFLALAMCLTIRYKFYGPVGESVLSITYLALLLGWLSKPKKHFQHLPAWLDVLLGCGIGLLMYTGHPFLIVCTALSLGFLMMFNREWKNLRFWTISLFTGGLLYYRFIFLVRNDYEEIRMSRMEQTLEVLGSFQNYHVYDIIVKYFDTQYHLPFVAFMIGLVVLAKYKHWLMSLYVFLSALAVLLIVFVSHAYLTSDILIMIDGYLTYVGLIWALPMAFAWVSLNRKWMLALTAIVFIFSLARIQSAHGFFTARLAYVQKALDENTTSAHPKGVAYLTDMNYEKLWIGWALSCETLLLSSLDGPSNSRTIYLANQRGDLDGRWEENNLYLNVHFGPDFIKPEDLPAHFFHLDKAPYREVELE